ncbi:MAG: hypothetical protein ABJH63_12280 [Rhizobiaceae bacterium]
MNGHLDNNSLSGHDAPDMPKTSPEGVLRLEEPAAGRRRLSKTKLFALSGLALVLVCFLAVGSVLWILINRSVSNEQVRAQIEAQLTSVLGRDHSAIVGATEVALGSGGLLSIDARDVKILHGGSTSLGVAREVGVKIKPIPLITGNVVAESVTMRGASIAIDSILAAPEDDTLRPLWPRSVNFDDALRRLGQTVGRIAGQVETAGLKSLNLEDANLVGFDQLGLRSRTAKIEFLSVEKLNKTDQPSELRIDARLATKHGAWSLTGNWTQTETDQHKLELRVGGMNLLDLVRDSGEEASAPTFAHDLGIKFVAQYAADGRPLPAQVTVDLGPGSIPVNDKGMRAELKGANVNISVDPVSNQLNIERSTIDFDGSSAIFTGAIRYPSSSQDSISLQPAFRFEVSEFQAFGLVEGADVPNGELLVEGFLDPIRQTVVADRVVLSMPNGELKGDASIRMDGPSPHIKAALALESMPVDEFKQFWPPVMAPKARKWISENLSGGLMKEAWVKLNFPPGMLGRDELYTKDNLAAQIVVESTRLNNPGELPTIENASGVVDVLGNHTNITLTDGMAEVANAGTVRLGKSTMKMGNYAIPITPARLDLNLIGPARAMVKLASLEPLGFNNRLDIKPSQISGKANTDIEAHFLIGKKLKVGNKPWGVRLSGKNIALKKPINGRMLSRGNMTLVASPKEARIKGTARLNNVPVKIALVENLDGSGPSKSEVLMTLSDKDRAKIGLDTGNVMTGTLVASLTDLSDGTRRVEADLRNTKLNFPWIGWTKGRGIPAKASFILRESRKGTSFEKFRLKGQGFSAEGSFLIDKKGLLSANMKNVMLNQVDDFDVTAKRAGAGYNIGLKARTYDGRALIRSLLSAEIKPSQSTAASIVVKGTVGRLIGFGNQSLSNVNIDFQQKGKRVSRVVIQALAPENAPTRFAMGPAPGGTQLEIATENAGSVLRFLDLYTKIRGGSITANLNRDASQTFRGRVIAKNFDMLNEPRLAQLLQKPSRAPQLNNNGDVGRRLRQINTDRARVDELQATIEKGTGFLNISRGRLWGGDAGAAFDGAVYDRNNRMNVTGTFLPGRGLNRLASKIPILGLAFGKGKVNGLVGITFQLVGRFDDPSLRVNPLSIIAPGVFRQIFRF